MKLQSIAKDRKDFKPKYGETLAEKLVDFRYLLAMQPIRIKRKQKHR